MNPKSLPTPPQKNAGSASLEKTLGSVRRPAVRLPEPPPPPEQPFASFVRSIVGTKKNSQPPFPSRSTPHTEEVIAETEVDGARYVILRYELRGRQANICLSPREQEIVSLIARGFPNKAIAEVLEISTWTVGTHLRRIFAKMGVTSRAAMVAQHLHGSGDGTSSRPSGTPWST